MRKENRFSVLRFNPALQAFPPLHLGIVCKHPLPSVCCRFRFPFSVLRFPFILFREHASPKPKPNAKYRLTNALPSNQAPR